MIPINTKSGSKRAGTLAPPKASQASKAEQEGRHNSFKLQPKDQFFYRAKTYDELQRIQADPPAFGFVEFGRTIDTIAIYDGDVFTGYEEVESLYPIAKYFVRTYPPAPKMNKLVMPVSNGGGQVEWSTKIYQPSAGASGSIVYFDQGIPLEQSTFGVGVKLGYPNGSALYGKGGLYQITGIKTYTGTDGKEYIESANIDYANGIRTDELMWLEVELYPPWGKDPRRLPMDADYETAWELPTFVPPDITEQ
jgi:hypothetical protein